jgi:hypothetical protein
MDLAGSNNAVALAAWDPEQPPANRDAATGEDDGTFDFSNGGCDAGGCLAISRMAGGRRF